MSKQESEESFHSISLLDPELQRYYQGRYLLEAWSKKGDRIFQKVLNEECTSWKLYNNVFIFKSSSESPLIYIMWLHERKMISIKHPFDDCKEVDMIYFDGLLIVAGKNNFKFAQVSASEVNNQIQQYQSLDENIQPMIQKDYVGLINQEKILALISNPIKHELIFLCQNDQQQLIPMRFINNTREKRQVSLQKLEADPNMKKVKLSKRMQKLLQQLDVPIQFQVVVKKDIPHLLVVRQNQIIEIIENFQQTIYAEQIPKFSKLLPSFGERITFQFEDGTMAQAQSLDKVAERSQLMEADYYKQIALPPKKSSIYDVHKILHFYSDMVIVNQSIFVLRDDIILLIDSNKKQVVQKFFTKQRVIGLFKLKQSNEDESGFKNTSYKIVALQRNGSIQILTPNDQYLNQEWQKQDLNNTPMLTNRDIVIQGFQNQGTQNYIYIKTITASGEQKIYQMMFNGQIIEVGIKLSKTDMIFNVFASSRSREFLGILDQKYFTIYKNDKGNLTKIIQIVLAQLDIKDAFDQTSLFYFQKDYLLGISKKGILKISTRTSQVERLSLSNMLENGGSCFLDSQYFYFLTKGDNENLTKLAIAGTDMIEAAISNNQNQSQNELVNIEQKKQYTLNYPTWNFGNKVRKLDYDEHNAVINLIMSNFQIVQVPLYHRNTIHFMGMGERQFYLAFRECQDVFYALDKQNYMNCWSTSNGKLLSRYKLIDKDYQGYECERKIYDKNWFSHFLIYKQNLLMDNEANNLIAFKSYNYKVLEIDEKGNVIERLSFDHQHQNNMNIHFYFNHDFTQMIELLINNAKHQTATYTHYVWSEQKFGKWEFLQTLTQQQEGFFEWHHKTLYPFNLNFKLLNVNEMDKYELQKWMQKLEVLKDVQKYELYKQTSTNRIKVLNIQDAIEMMFNADTGKLESFLALQYSFTNIKESFYDEKCGQFYVQQVTLRLQNQYEEFRRMIFLNNQLNRKARSIDISARDFRYKYVLEQTYTELDHQFYKQFIQGKQKQTLQILKSLSVEHINRLVHNIFPDQNNTILHYLAESNLGFESIDYLMDLSKKEKFLIPFIINDQELTPLDITVNLKDHKQSNSIVKMLSKAPLDHHSRFISHLLPTLIEMGLPALEKYFDKRKFKTSLCNSITLGRLKIGSHQHYVAVSSTLINDEEQSLRSSLMHPQFREQSINLDMIDIPLKQMKQDNVIVKNNDKLSLNDQTLNTYEIQLIKSIANTENLDILNQKTVRAFINFTWPKARKEILTNLFLPYLAFILYYMIYLMVLKRLNLTQSKDPAFFKFTSDMFVVYDFIFKMILFFGCFYFFYQDFLQIKSFSTNRIVLWSYANVFPLIIMIFIIIYDTFIDSNSPLMEKAFYSGTAFFIWIRVIHLLKCFSQTSYIIRMASEILYRMRFLICFIIISLLAFGFTFFFLSDLSYRTPKQGIEYMFLMMLGNYDPADFNNIFLDILFITAVSFNVFFVFTMLIALSVQALSQEQSSVWENENYQDKACLMALYSYLLQEKPIRDPTKDYLMIATVNEAKQRKELLKKQQANGNFDAQIKQLNAKLSKNIEKRLNVLTSKVEKSLKEIQDKIDMGDDNKSSESRSRSKIQ